ncbi:MAG: hypothetical protein ACT4OE_00455 [Sphingosinicella sp.]
MTPPIRVIVGLDGTTCYVRLGGETFRLTSDDDSLLLMRFRELRATHDKLHLMGEGINPPYRCIGRAIYDAQLVGFGSIHFLPKPAE